MNQFVEVRNQSLIYLNSAALCLLFKKRANSVRVMYSLFEELLMIIDGMQDVFNFRAWIRQSVRINSFTVAALVHILHSRGQIFADPALNVFFSPASA